MPDKIRLSEKNQININRLSQVINASSTALVNYIINKGALVLEESFNKMDMELKEAFKQALSKKK